MSLNFFENWRKAPPGSPDPKTLHELERDSLCLSQPAYQGEAAYIPPTPPGELTVPGVDDPVADANVF